MFIVRIYCVQKNQKFILPEPKEFSHSLSIFFFNLPYIYLLEESSSLLFSFEKKTKKQNCNGSMVLIIVIDISKEPKKPRIFHFFEMLSLLLLFFSVISVTGLMAGFIFFRLFVSFSFFFQL